MSVLVAIFLGLFVYGLLINHLGGALMALFMAVFSMWAIRKLNKQDAEHMRNNPVAETATSNELDRYECECCRSEF